MVVIVSNCYCQQMLLLLSANIIVIVSSWCLPRGANYLLLSAATHRWSEKLVCIFLHWILHNYYPTWYDDMSGTDCPSKVRSGAVRLILNPSWVQVPNLSEQFCSSKGNQVMSILQVDLKIPVLKWGFCKILTITNNHAIRPGLIISWEGWILGWKGPVCWE